MARPKKNKTTGEEIVGALKEANSAVAVGLDSVSNESFEQTFSGEVNTSIPAEGAVTVPNQIKTNDQPVYTQTCFDFYKVDGSKVHRIVKIEYNPETADARVVDTVETDHQASAMVNIQAKKGLENLYNVKKRGSRFKTEV